MTKISCVVELPEIYEDRLYIFEPDHVGLSLTGRFLAGFSHDAIELACDVLVCYHHGRLERLLVPSILFWFL